MFCSNCGTQVADGQHFCSACGNALTPVAPTVPVQPVTPVQPAAPVQPAIPVQGPVIVKPVAPAFANPKNRNLMIIIGIGVVVALLLTAVLFMGGGKDLRNTFSDYANEYWCTVSSDGTWMEVDTNPYDEDDFLELAAWDGMQDMLTRMGFSSSVAERMKSTRAVDGMQFEENAEYELSWTYHPDEGLEVLIELK